MISALALVHVVVCRKVDFDSSGFAARVRYALKINTLFVS